MVPIHYKDQSQRSIFASQSQTPLKPLPKLESVFKTLIKEWRRNTPPGQKNCSLLIRWFYILSTSMRVNKSGRASLYWLFSLCVLLSSLEAHLSVWLCPADISWTVFCEFEPGVMWMETQKRVHAEHVFVCECINNPSQQNWHGAIQTMWQKIVMVSLNLGLQRRSNAGWEMMAWPSAYRSLKEHVGLCTRSYIGAPHLRHLWWLMEIVLLRKSEDKEGQI